MTSERNSLSCCSLRNAFISYFWDKYIELRSLTSGVSQTASSERPIITDPSFGGKSTANTIAEVERSCRYCPENSIHGTA